MATDPTAISRAKRMLGMDPTTPFPNNIREPSPDEIQGMRISGAGDIAGIPRDAFNSLTAEQQAGILGSSALAGLPAPFISGTTKLFPSASFSSIFFVLIRS